MKYVYFLIIIVVLSGCARRGNPSGGPKDKDAPILINTIPNHKSTNFNAKEIKIYFDEYIKLEDVQKNLVISPPLKYQPIITPLGVPSKRLTIKIKDTLKTNTTYTFNFGESIIDNNEGNVLSNFKYIFSTGNYIDSLKISGSISDAFRKNADKDVSVLLYEINDSYTDSVIFKEKPFYITNVLDSIGWEITNMKSGKYRLIALKEDNRDFIYNPKTDKIGFIDTIISVPTETKLHVKLFKEVPKFETAKPKEFSKGHLIFGYYGAAKNFKIKLKDDLKNFQSHSIFETDKDTLNYYYSSDKQIDSLQFELINTNYSKLETVKMRSSKIDTMIVRNKTGRTLHPNDTVKISINNPLVKFDKTKISLIDKDTINVPFTIVNNKKHDLSILFEHKESQFYKLKLLPNAITDFFEQTNDTINYSFRTQKLVDYGSINLTVKNTTYPIIVQLLTEKEEFVSEIIASEKQDFLFEHLSPAKYLVKIIFDTNKNGVWDAGNFMKKIQPEKVMFYNKSITLKKNWNVNEIIEVK
jgi:uncharacterized protein (DUF2141 family)